MANEQLLSDLELMSHSDRIRVMVELGRQQSDESKAAIAELERGGFYERQLALYSCFGSRDPSHILRAVNDPSHLLRGLASRLVALHCDDGDSVRALEVAHLGVRLAIAYKLHKRGRAVVIDTFLAQQTISAREFSALLPFASRETLDRMTTQFTSQATDHDWLNLSVDRSAFNEFMHRLARLHPSAAFTILEGQIAAMGDGDGRLIARVNLLLSALTNADPDRALALVTSLSARGLLRQVSSEPLRALARRRPAGVAELLLAEPTTRKPPIIQLAAYAGRLTAQQVIALYRLNTSYFGWDASWFHRLAPQSRAEVFANIGSLLLIKRHLRTQIIAALPTADREREARLDLSLPRTTLLERIQDATYLPWDEATEFVNEYLHSAEAPTRQAALKALIGAVKYHREHIDDALDIVHMRRTEQDGIRQVMLAALRELPAGIWREEHLPTLGEIIRHGLDDVGLSLGTRAEMSGLLLKLLPSFPEWASAQLMQILRERGWAKPQSWSAPLPPAAELQLAQALVSVFTLWAERDNVSAILDSLSALLRRPAAFGVVSDTVVDLLRTTTDRHHSERALQLLSERAHHRFVEIVPELPAEDASWITFPIISDYLARRRQDLFAPFLTLQAYEGRWGTRRQPLLPPLSARFTGGTATQQERYASAAMVLATDDTLGTHVTMTAIKWLALLPAIAAARLATLADDSRPIARTTALFALARLDTADGLPTLLAAVQDSRARIAIHALRRFLVTMPIQQALEIIRTIPTDRVTVAKEVVRLVSELPAEEAYVELVALAHTDLHRDVRIALLRALDAHLHHPQTWDILEQAASSPDRAIALAPLSLTALRTSHAVVRQEDTATQRHILRLLATLVVHPDAEARKSALKYCALLGIADEARNLAPILADRVASSVTAAQTRAEYDEALAFAEAFFGVCTPEDWNAATRVVWALMPHRRLLKEAIRSLNDAPRLRERHLLPIVQVALVELAKDPLTARLQIDLAVGRLPADELYTFFTKLARGNGLHADSLAYAAQKLEGVRKRSDAAKFEALEPKLGSSRDERLRRLGFAILQSRAGSLGEWNEALLERLRVYRADRSVLVALAAQFTNPDTDDPGA